jgi:hypothetical protein
MQRAKARARETTRARASNGAARLAAAPVAAATLGLTSPAGARGSIQADAVTVYTMSPGRIGALMAGVVGLSAVVIGGLALARSARGTGDARRGALVALVLGPSALLGGALVVATAGGGIGTGNGLGGGIVALLVGVIGTVLGGLARIRSRRLS